MTDSDYSGHREAVKGAVEDVKGKAKEALGTVTGRDDLVREGQAQQDKAEAERGAAEKEVQAERERATASVEEQRQRAEQRSR